MAESDAGYPCHSWDLTLGVIIAPRPSPHWQKSMLLVTSLMKEVWIRLGHDPSLKLLAFCSLETGGIVCVCVCIRSCLTLCHPMDGSPLGSSFHEIYEARILEVAISSSRGSSWPRDGAHIFCISCIGRWILYHWAPWGFPGDIEKELIRFLWFVHIISLKQHFPKCILQSSSSER